VETSLARAEIYLQGAQVTAYAHPAGAPLLFVSQASRFEAGVPIRGGVPLVFPWFGRKADDAEAPQHGPARRLPWRLEEATTTATDVVELTFALTEVSVARWPDGAALRYRVGIGAALALTLEVENRGRAPFRFEEALHTYLAVDDVEHIHVTGLEGATYLDETQGFARQRDAAGPLVVRGETDRVYDDTPATCVVWDPGAHRRVEISKTGSDATIVWNPGAARARALPDLGDEEWRQFVCVESGNVGPGAVTIAPGARHSLTVRIQSEPWDSG
jgi:glucose-6-phosphate 1-epimerase